MEISKEKLAAEIARRRTFAIISHPDAGKMTQDLQAARFCQGGFDGF